MGKFLAREFQENIDLWEQRVEPRLGMNRDRISLSAALLMHLSLAFLTLVFGMLLFDRERIGDRATLPEIAQVVLGIVLVIIIFNRLLPYAFFTRTRGAWIVRWRWFLQLMMWLVHYAVYAVRAFNRRFGRIAAQRQRRHHCVGGG